jgi:hypothetical protein
MPFGERTLPDSVERNCQASFRDPAGYVYRENGAYKRIVTADGIEDYRQLMTSGLYERLVQESLLVRHEEQVQSEEGAILVPEQIRYISYPYEWCFGELQDAALLTLRIQELAMQYGMSLKDASAFNVQFRGVQPVFIDTLSFEPNLGGPWVAYDQFCRHFLAPLMLMSQVSAGFNRFWKASLDGFPLELASTLLPKRTYFKPGILLHLHLHARMQKKYADVTTTRSRSFAASKIDRKPALVASLRHLIESIKPGQFETEWQDYYDEKATHYSRLAEESKKKAVEEALDRVNPRLLYDFGSNNGEYSRLAAQRGVYTVCFDIDPVCVHDNYERARHENDGRILPLMLDLTNPTPSLGVALGERDSLVDRGRADMALALALLHHLRITGNVPFRHIARLLADMTDYLLIEYVPKTDEKVQALLSNRKDIFYDYTPSGFHAAFQLHFDVLDTFTTAETDRVLYLFRRKIRP